ncbi:TerC family protein [Anaeroselena agilis]|uniref:TerC family protein n=1 Tax=Anaeroselena agilis TaxID=3063788 RepID=A0ABU3NZ54_9FIRM|nr:TerC family protein [Selenomonadales bacterium 4137-cl]
MDYLTALFSIMMINLLLSGDNALVIALASRRLPPAQQRQAVLWGGAGAIGMRIILTLAAVLLLKVPYLQIAGGLLLQWVAVKLVADDHSAGEEVEAAGNLWDAVKTILIADLVMSLDNVIAIAGVSRGNISLLVIGLALSIPIIIWGSTLITKLMQRWPVIVVIGAAFLGWTAGDMLVADPAAQPLAAAYPFLHWAVPGVFAAAVVAFEFLKDRPKGRGEGQT